MKTDHPPSGLLRGLDLLIDAAERVNAFASPCFMNLLLKPGCSSRRFSPLRVG